MESAIEQRALTRQFFWQKVVIVIWITLFWLLVSFYQYFDRFFILLDRECIENYPHGPLVRNMLVSLLLGGLLGGTALVFIWEKWLRSLPFIKAIGYMFAWYCGLYVLLTFIAITTYDGADSPLHGQPFHKAILPAIFNIALLPNFIFWLCVMLVTLTFLLIREKFGPGVFGSFLLGKYFRPKKESRIFMFMDLKSSTTIAEELGEERYFEFLSDTFSTATPGIMVTKGEIYQYVGDEVVVTWPMALGLKQGNCIRCFKAMKELLNRNASKFQSKYGVMPQFKAGLHAGEVIAGEIGVIKREIVYTGDVLNTTARIQSKCNELGVDILVSETLAGKLDERGALFHFRNLGPLELKGKSDTVTVTTLG